MPVRAIVIMLGFLLCFSKASLSQEKIEVLPEPLTLEYALSRADLYHPDLAVADSLVQQAQSDVLIAEANDDLDIRLRAQAQWIDPAEFSPYQDSDNHRLSLLVNKPLYNFGKQALEEQVASSQLHSQQYSYLETRQKRRLEIMRRYFDVLLADLRFYRYNEAMASAYVKVDKLRKRQKAGQVGELEILEREVYYQEMRRMRTMSRNNQRLTRSALAIAMGNPELVPDTLAKPDIVVDMSKLPELEILQQQAIDKSPAVKALRARLDASQKAVEIARKSDSPVLTAQLEAHSYARETGATDPWRAGFVLDIPLSKGGRTDASIAKQKARLYQLQSQLKKSETSLKQDILALWLEMESMKIKRDEAKALSDYSELYLDKSRTLYEMEVQSTLGDAMITITKSHYEVLKADLDLIYAWAKMDALTGNLIKE